MLGQNIAKPGHSTWYVFMHMNDALSAGATPIRTFSEINCTLGRTMLQITNDLFSDLATNILLGFLGAAPNMRCQNNVALAFEWAIKGLFDTLGLNREYI